MSGAFCCHQPLTVWTSSLCHHLEHTLDSSHMFATLFVQRGSHPSLNRRGQVKSAQCHLDSVPFEG